MKNIKTGFRKVLAIILGLMTLLGLIIGGPILGAILGLSSWFCWPRHKKEVTAEEVLRKENRKKRMDQLATQIFWGGLIIGICYAGYWLHQQKQQAEIAKLERIKIEQQAKQEALKAEYNANKDQILQTLKAGSERYHMGVLEEANELANKYQKVTDPDFTALSNKVKQRFKKVYELGEDAEWEIKQYIRSNMHDPDSYEYVETKVRPIAGGVMLSHTYRGKNLFGAITTETVKAKITEDRKLTIFK